MVLVWAMTARESARPDVDAFVCVRDGHRVYRTCTYVCVCVCVCVCVYTRTPYTVTVYGPQISDEREREKERENRRECIPVTSSRRTRVHQAYTHASSRGRVCVARAPHGNDESSTLEHLASCSFLPTFHRALSLTRQLSVTDPLSLSLSLSFSRSCPTPFRLRQPALVCP